MTNKEKLLEKALKTAVKYNMKQTEISPCNICPLLEISCCVRAYNLKATMRNCEKFITEYFLSLAAQSIKEK